MSDILNGKLIYQLTSASALRDTDLFVISSADNLTRSVTLSQLRSAVTSGYSNDEIDTLIDDLKMQLKDISDRMSDYENDIFEFRNEFNNYLNDIRSSFTNEINNVRSEFNSNITKLETNVNKQFTETNKHISDLRTMDTSLTNKINEVDTRLTNAINGLISYGTAVPSTLATGKIYLQYF